MVLLDIVQLSAVGEQSGLHIERAVCVGSSGFPHSESGRFDFSALDKELLVTIGLDEDASIPNGLIAYIYIE